MDATFLAADLKKADPDRYLLSLFVPREKRAAITALFLFNHEIARTREVVSDTRLGLIRLQWWRDEIDRIYRGGDGGQIPVLSTLAPHMRAGDIPQEWFEALLYAREFDLQDVAPSSVEGLYHYADFTTTPLNKIALQILGQTADESEIGRISTIFGLMEIVRGVPFMLSQARCYLPEDLLVQKQLSSRKIIDFNHQKEIADVVEILISGIEAYRKPKNRFLALQQRMAFIYLDHIKKNRFDVFLPKTQMPPVFLALRLLF